MSGAVTQLLNQMRRGEDVGDVLLNTTYKQLHDMANRVMYGDRKHSLQPTALIHEAYLKLFSDQTLQANDRVHFFALAAKVMRQVLVDHARARKSERRGGQWVQVPLLDVDQIGGDFEIDEIGIDLLC